MISRLLHAARSTSRVVHFGLRTFADNRDSRVMLTHNRGMDIIQDPDLNKVCPPRPRCAHSISRVSKGNWVFRKREGPPRHQGPRPSSSLPHGHAA